MNKRNLLFVALIFFSIGAMAQTFQWNTGGTVGGSHGLDGSSIDANGNTILTGHYQSSLKIDTITKNYANYSKGSYIAKLNAKGKVQWMKNVDVDYVQPYNSY